MSHLPPARRAVILGGGAAFSLAVRTEPAIGQQFSDSYTFLRAVRERDATKVQQLLSNPASTVINARARDTGEGALHIVVHDGDVQWLTFLLGHGARPDAQTNVGDTPLLLCARLGWLEGAELLLVAQARPNLANGRGTTPLMAAVVGRNLVMVRLLLSWGADPNQADGDGSSAIDYARQDPRAGSILNQLLATRPG